MTLPLLPRSPTPFGFEPFEPCCECGTLRPVAELERPAMLPLPMRAGVTGLMCRDSSWCCAQRFRSHDGSPAVVDDELEVVS